MKELPDHIVVAVTELAGVCKGGKADEPTIRLFAKYLADADPESVMRAVTAWCAANTFFPAVAEIRALLVPFGEIATASDAWEEACGWVSRVGYCGKPNWSSPMVERAAVATCGSWEAFCTSPSDQLPSKRARFFEIYGDFATSEKRHDNELTAAKLYELSAPRSGSTMSQGEIRELHETAPGEETEEDRKLRRWEEGARDDEGDL